MTSSNLKADAKADAKFLRRVFMGLIFLTVLSGTILGLSTVQAMTGTPGSCVIFCG